MQFLNRALGIFLGLALVSGLALVGYVGVKKAVGLSQRLDFQVVVVMVGAATLLLAATIVARGIRRGAALGREVQLHEGKAEAYRKFIALWEELLGPGHAPDSMTQLSQQVQTVNRLLVLHASAAVVKAHTAMQLNLVEARAQFGSVLLQIRDELGLESRGLSADDLIQLVLAEPDDGRDSRGPGARQGREPHVSLRSTP
jgi:hypothetical protein